MKRKKQSFGEKFTDALTKENFDKVVDEMSKVGGEVKKMVGHAKNRFDTADVKTRKKILAGLAGATAVLALLIGAKKMRKRKK